MTPRRRINCQYENGFASALELAVWFLTWIKLRGTREPRWYDVAAHFGVSRATAYRWIRDYRSMRSRLDSLA